MTSVHCKFHMYEYKYCLIQLLSVVPVRHSVRIAPTPQLCTTCTLLYSPSLWLAHAHKMYVYRYSYRIHSCHRHQSELLRDLSVIASLHMLAVGNVWRSGKSRERERTMKEFHEKLDWCSDSPRFNGAAPYLRVRAMVRITLPKKAPKDGQ